jgi:hypothetical protein
MSGDQIDSYREKRDQQRLFLRFYIENGGSVDKACVLAGIDRRMFYGWIQTSKSFRERLSFQTEALKDHVESRLMGLINDGNIKAITLWLNAHAQDRGYGNPKVLPKKDESRTPEVIIGEFCKELGPGRK